MPLGAGVSNKREMCIITLTCAACLTVKYLSHYLINGTIFGQKILVNIKSVF